ncbi:MAG: GspH/FimT family pseudopilin [Acidobacteria bacterium]|nr:GspH/FimT family pseudopilin [Acidobacteriota bacterium]
MKEQGYCLVELAIIVGIAATLAVSAAPALLSVRDAWNLHTEAARFAETLEQARLHAILANTSVRLTLSGDRYTLRASNTAGCSLPLGAGVRFAGPQKSILFSSRGTASPAATLLLVHKTRELSIVVSPAGRVRIGP